MLGKLFRYECKATGRILMPIFGAVVLMGLVSAMLFKFMPQSQWEENIPMTVLTVVSMFLFFCLILVALVCSFIFSIIRFRKSLLGSEGYLMNTLPVSVWENIGAKLLTAVLYQIIAMIVAGGSGVLFLLTGSGVGIQEIIRDINILVVYVVNNMPGEGWLIMLEILFLLFFSLVETNLMIYAAMSVGHSVNSHKILVSVGVYVGFYIVAQIINSLLLFPLLLGQTDFGQAQLTSKFAHMLFLEIGVIELIYIAAYGFITHYFLKNRLNLE